MKLNVTMDHRNNKIKLYSKKKVILTLNTAINICLEIIILISKSTLCYLRTKFST